MGVSLQAISRSLRRTGSISSTSFMRWHANAAMSLEVKRSTDVDVVTALWSLAELLAALGRSGGSGEKTLSMRSHQ